MRLIRQRTLSFQEGNSDKVYEADLCEAGKDEFVVNFRYGRRGSRLREGTKTPFPEPLEKAEKIFEKLVQSKLNKGYRDQTPDEETTGDQPQEEPTSAQGGNEAQRAKVAEALENVAAVQPGLTWKLSRIVWRAGEMGGLDAAATIAKIASSESMDEYAIAWALGKTGSAEAIPRLQQLQSNSKDEKVRRIAGEALLRCLDEPAREALAKEFRQTLPESIREALENPETNAAQLTSAVEDRLQNAEPPHDYLYTLYTQADFFPAARETIHNILSTRPLKAPWFRAIRHIFKAAEFRLDAEIFGLIAWRFEKTDSAFSAPWGYLWDPDTQKSVNVAEELRKPDSRYAYSANTRAYLRRRVCRTLKRFGELNDPASFITLATGVLLAYNDEFDQKEVRSKTEWRWVAGQGSFTIEKFFGPYAGYLPLNYLLYAHSDRYEFKSGKTWIAADEFQPSDNVGETLPPKREEAFAHLWNHAPDALEHLLRHSKCAAVHEFSVKAWRDNPVFNQKVDVPFILALLARPYQVTQELAIDLARERFDPAKPDGELMLALLGCDFPTARELALGWLRECRDVFAGDARFIASVILIPHDDVHADLRAWLGTARPGLDVLEIAVPKVVAGLLELDPETNPNAEVTARNARETLLLIGGDRLAGVSHPVIRDLLKHSVEENRILGAQFLSLGSDSAEEIPDELWELLLNSETIPVREIGMRLFGKLGDVALLERAEILASFCLSEKDDIRRAARPIVERLAAHSPGFGQDLVLQFYPLTLREESIEGLHEDVYELLSGPLKSHLHAIPAESCFRMMESRYTAGQRLGFLILKNFVGLDDQPMRQVAKLASQDHLEGREYVWNYYRERLNRIREEKADALRVVDSNWDDTREFAFGFFREQFTDEDWTPEVLVSLCDSVRGEVQDFGREMITRFFKEENGQDYLLKLSQHPTSELQTFATNYLERFATGNLDRIGELELYFITVLSQVNRGRVAKQRVLQFLANEALANREIAALVTPLLERIAATIAIGDKAACIKTLREISARWPDLESPLKKIEPPVFAPE